jgi:hypothetical protein
MINFTSKYDVREWLAGAATFFWFALIASSFGGLLICPWGLARPYDFKREPILRKAEIVLANDSLPTLKPTKVINSYIADDKAIVDTVRNDDGTIHCFRIVTHTTSYFGRDVDYVWANIDNAKSCKLVE